MFRAIIFDLGKVIVPFDFNRGYQALEPFCPHSASELPERIQATGLLPRFEMGLIAPEDFVRGFSKELHLNVGYTEFCTIWSSIFLPDTLIPETLLTGLRENYRLLLLSNTNAIHFESIRVRYPLIRHFHHLVLSYEVRAMKPDPAIYRHAIQAAACRPEECVFIDDIQENVDAAIQEGMTAMQFTGIDRLRQDFQRLGIR